MGLLPKHPFDAAWYCAKQPLEGIPRRLALASAAPRIDPDIGNSASRRRAPGDRGHCRAREIQRMGPWASLLRQYSLADGKDLVGPDRRTLHAHLCAFILDPST